jgi:hypothetical protein
MMRPDLTVLFVPVPAGPWEVVRAFLDLGEREFWLRISYYFDALKFDPGKGKYRPADEPVDLSGRDDLLQSIATVGDYIWSCEMMWSRELLVRVKVAVFRDPSGKPETTLMLVIDSKVTTLVEDDPESRMPFVLFLCRIADAIGSPWFVCGPHIRSWRPLTLDQLPGAGDLSQLYVVGWKRDSPVAEEILAYYSLEPEGLGTTLLGYDFWAKFSWLT